MNIRIDVPYAQPECVPIWARQEDQIDFRTDREGADRCTLSHAADELKRFLERTLKRPSVRFVSDPEHGAGKEDRGDLSLVIVLRIAPEGGPAGTHRLKPGPGRLEIIGEDRVGVLYGVYRFLERQGWRWLSPGDTGEIRPEPSDTLDLPPKTETHRPGFPLCRGFDFSGVSRESAELFHWMARNRLNLAGHRPATGALGRKLGLIYKNGGHIFEEMLDPARVMEGGRTLWEEHRAWYGLPAGGRRIRAKALRTQFCVSQPDLLDFLAEELVRRIETEWREADLVAVWGFDTWGSCCTCPHCRALGNDTDQYLVLLSRLRREIDRARETGRLGHPVRMAGCAYEGTSSLPGPNGRIPQNLIDAGDTIIFYPIDRSYAADLYDPKSVTNRRYASALDSWLDRPDRLPIIVGEYYNVSKFEDLPLLFTDRIVGDLGTYRRKGVAGMTYMHFPLVNWAVRTLTQYHYARANWQPGRPAGPLVQSYLKDRYGPHAESMAPVYQRIESGFSRISEWRNWHGSILQSLMHWDGSRPGGPLAVPKDLQDAAGAIRNGESSLRLLRQALETVEERINVEQQRDALDPEMAFRVAVNPVDTHGLRKGSPYAMALGEDRRLLRYGCDTMELMTETVRYHQALAANRDADAAGIWICIEKVADRLDSYWVPIDYEYPGAGLHSRDGLTRSQLRDLLARCRRSQPKMKIGVERTVIRKP